MIDGMEPATTLQFAHTARTLAREARARGLAVPGFRSPPRLAGADRTLLRRGRSASVAIRVRGRPWEAVLADMVEGVVVANGLQGDAADQAREALVAAVGEADVTALVPDTKVA
jgi:hypothetical protein